MKANELKELLATLDDDAELLVSDGTDIFLVKELTRESIAMKSGGNTGISSSSILLVERTDNISIVVTCRLDETWAAS